MVSHSSVVMSSNKHDWQTPEHILDAVRQVDVIGLDPCTRESNPTGAKVFYTQIDNGYGKDWSGHGLTFVNPPYGRDVGFWLTKCATADSAVALPASRTDTKWFHETMKSARLMCLLEGRLRFKGADGPAPFPSVVFGWPPLDGCDPWIGRFRHAFDPLGKVMNL